MRPTFPQFFNKSFSYQEPHLANLAIWAISGAPRGPQRAFDRAAATLRSSKNGQIAEFHRHIASIAQRAFSPWKTKTRVDPVLVVFMNRAASSATSINVPV